MFFCYSAFIRFHETILAKQPVDATIHSSDCTLFQKNIKYSSICFARFLIFSQPGISVLLSQFVANEDVATITYQATD